MSGSFRVQFAWAFASVVVVAASAAWTAALRPHVPQAIDDRVHAPRSPLVSIDESAVVAGASALVTRNPFRLARTPARVPFEPWPTAGEPTAVPAAPIRPTLILAGILGPPWHALIEGIPGNEQGVLLGVGGRIGGIRLLRVSGDTAFLDGLDTTWTLTTRRP